MLAVVGSACLWKTFTISDAVQETLVQWNCPTKYFVHVCLTQLWRLQQHHKLRTESPVRFIVTRSQFHTSATTPAVLIEVFGPSPCIPRLNFEWTQFQCTMGHFTNQLISLTNFSSHGDVVIFGRISTAPTNLNFGARLRWVVNITPRPLYPPTTSK
jgi:hypothetical protein